MSYPRECLWQHKKYAIATYKLVRPGAAVLPTYAGEYHLAHATYTLLIDQEATLTRSPRGFNYDGTRHVPEAATV